MKCREAVHITNTGQFKGLWHRVRYYAHLLACIACVRYLRVSNAISLRFRSYLQGEVENYNLNELNKKLVQKLADPKN